MKSTWDGMCVLCSIGRPRINTTLCDRCLRAWLKRQRDKHKKPRGICVSWGDEEWKALHKAVIEYLTQLERNADEEGA